MIEVNTYIATESMIKDLAVLQYVLCALRIDQYISTYIWVMILIILANM